MNTHADKTHENKNQAVANAVSQKKSSSESTFQFVDNRPEAVAQRKLQEMANNSTRLDIIQKKSIDGLSEQQVKNVGLAVSNDITNKMNAVVDHVVASGHAERNRTVGKTYFRTDTLEFLDSHLDQVLTSPDKVSADPSKGNTIVFIKKFEATTGYKANDDDKANDTPVKRIIVVVDISKVPESNTLSPEDVNAAVSKITIRTFFPSS